MASHFDKIRKTHGGGGRGPRALEACKTRPQAWFRFRMTQSELCPDVAERREKQKTMDHGVCCDIKGRPVHGDTCLGCRKVPLDAPVGSSKFNTGTTNGRDGSHACMARFWTTDGSCRRRVQNKGGQLLHSRPFQNVPNGRRDMHVGRRAACRHRRGVGRPGLLPAAKCYNGRVTLEKGSACRNRWAGGRCDNRQRRHRTISSAGT